MTILGFSEIQNAVANMALGRVQRYGYARIETTRPLDAICLVRQAAETLEADVICTVDPDGTVGVRAGRFGRKPT